MAYLCCSLVLFRSGFGLTLLHCFGCTCSLLYMSTTWNAYVIVARATLFRARMLIIYCRNVCPFLQLSVLPRRVQSSRLSVFVLSRYYVELLVQLRCCVWRVGWAGRLSPRRLEKMCWCTKLATTPGLSGRRGTCRNSGAKENASRTNNH